MPHDQYDTTFHGLHDWHKHMFEKLGWMVLAKSHGYYDKTNSYLKSCTRLQEALTQKMNVYTQTDKKLDLEVLLKNVNILCTTANKMLKGSKGSKGSKGRDVFFYKFTNVAPPPPITAHPYAVYTNWMP